MSQIINVAEILFGRFPRPPAVASRRVIRMRIDDLRAEVEKWAAEVERLRLIGALGGTEYMHADRQTAYYRNLLASRVARRAEIERLRQAEAEYRRIQAEAAVEGKLITAERDKLAKDDQLETPAGFALTNRALAIASTIAGCEQRLTGGNIIDQDGAVDRGFVGERKRLEDQKIQVGDED